MLLTVDGQAIPTAPQPADTVGHLVAQMAAGLAAHRLLVSGIRVDGADYLPETHDHLPPAAVGSVELTTETFASVASRLSEGAAALADSVAQACAIAARELSGGSTEAALNLVAECVDGLGALAKVTEQLLLVDPPLAAGWAGLDGALPAMTDALRNRDYVSLADILSFELVPGLTDWQATLAAGGTAGEA